MEDKDRILHHVSEKFLTEGFTKTSMDEIASDMRMSKKTIYKYFLSKDSLVFATADIIQNHISKNISKIVDSDESSLVKLQKITEFMLKLSLKVSPKWIADIQVYKPELWDRIEEFRTKIIFENFNKLIDQGKKEELIVDKPNIIILTVVLSSIQGVINPKFLTENNFSAREAGIIVFDIVFSGILTKKGRKLFKHYRQET